MAKSGIDHPMVRYVAIGALVGFVVAYFLLSHEGPAPAADLSAPPANLQPRRPPGVGLPPALPIANLPQGMPRRFAPADGG